MSTDKTIIWREVGGTWQCGISYSCQLVPGTLPEVCRPVCGLSCIAWWFWLWLYEVGDYPIQKRSRWQIRCCYGVKYQWWILQHVIGPSLSHWRFFWCGDPRRKRRTTDWGVQMSDRPAPIIPVLLVDVPSEKGHGLKSLLGNVVYVFVPWQRLFDGHP